MIEGPVASGSSLVTFLFTDIEGSAALWELEPERMRVGLACHDALTKIAVETNRGALAKMIGDGALAVFDDPLDAIAAALGLQQSLLDPDATAGVRLPIRCGIHTGPCERRSQDYFGPAVNRAARIMAAAHGGQILLSQATAELVRNRLDPHDRLRDLGPVRLRDLAQPERIHQFVNPSLPDEFPEPRSVDATPHNLPLPLTSFIGRERELADLRKLIGEARLVTLLGPGGIGKTRLALHAVADLSDRFPDGIWFVELASVSDPHRISQAVASVLGVGESGGVPFEQTLRTYTRNLRLLIILDNCEHLVDACARLVSQMLSSASGLYILASSREPLRIAGESCFAVPPLSTPVEDAVVTVETISRYESARLFIDRARAVLPTYTLTDREARAISRICARLDGIALAIELAAVQTRILAVEDIADRLADRLRILSRGHRTAMPRHQTLRASIDWSYDLLSNEEKSLLLRLAVFAGGWTLDAAEAVGGDTDAGAVDVLDVLGNLVEKSLVSRDVEGTRFRLLHPIRQYALEKLEAQGDLRATRERHLAYFVDLAERAWVQGSGSSSLHARLDLEQENLFVAFDSCASLDGGATAGLSLARSLKNWMISRGLLALGYRLMVRSIDLAGGADDGLLRGQASSAAGELAYLTGDYRSAKVHMEEALAIARRSADRRQIAEAQRLLGYVLLAHREWNAARECFQSALALSRERSDDGQIAAALNGLAEFHRSQQDLGAALPLYREAVALDRIVGDQRRLAVHLCNLAGVLIGLREREETVPVLLEALVIARQMGSRQIGRFVLEDCACLAALRQDWENAVRLYGAAEQQSEAMGYHREPMDANLLPPLMARMHDALDAATFSGLEQVGRNWDYGEALREACVWLESCGPVAS